MGKKLWGGRFKKGPHKIAQSFTESISYDQRLYLDDIEGSVAHVKMLGRQGIIPREEAEQIVTALGEIREEIDKGDFAFKEELEDIHLNIESRLIEKIGPVGGKLHTARSRNDQIALDERLFLRREIGEINSRIKSLAGVFVRRAEEHVDTVLPMYTHLQRAQPVSLGHYLLAYFEMLDRDHLIEFLSACSILAMHMSRLSEELVLWSSVEFDFVDLGDEFTTGSSIMPQKRNPDVAELARGKTARVYGNLFTLLTLMKGLPFSYNRDMQEDKEPLFDTIDTIKSSLQVMTAMLEKARFKPMSMANALKGGFSTATDLADYLAQKGLPFREAHGVVGSIVSLAEERGCGLGELSLDELTGFSELFERDVFDHITIKGSVDSRKSYGGTSRENTAKQIELCKKRLAEW